MMRPRLNKAPAAEVLTSPGIAFLGGFQQRRTPSRAVMTVSKPMAVERPTALSRVQPISIAHRFSRVPLRASWSPVKSNIVRNKGTLNGCVSFF